MYERKDAGSIDDDHDDAASQVPEVLSAVYALGDVFKSLAETVEDLRK